jgi:hypothetical protein
MFNAAAFDRKMAETDKIERLKNRYVKDAPVYKKKTEKLAHNYKKRVENFVLQMIDHPVVTQDVTPEMYKYRDEEPEKFIGDAAIIIRSFKSEKDRITDSLSQHKYYQCDYEHPRVDFRPRDRSKDIQPEMHFKSKPMIERIAQRLERAGGHPVDGRKIDRNDPLLVELSKSPVQATNKYVAKFLLPELNVKTHFKAATSLYLGLPDSLVDDKQKLRHSLTSKSAKYLTRMTSKPDFDYTETIGMEDINNGNNRRYGTSTNKLPAVRGNNAEGQDESESLHATRILPGGQERNYQLDGINPVEVSKKILFKCNVIRNRHGSTSPLAKGSGHLTSYPDKTVREVYHDVLHKTMRS